MTTDDIVEQIDSATAAAKLQMTSDLNNAKPMMTRDYEEKIKACQGQYVH